eukprot:282307_1
MQQQVNGTLKPQFTRQACKEIELSKESSSRLQRKLKKLLCGTRPILLYPKVGDSKAVVRHFVSHPDDFNTPHGLHRVIKRHNILDTEVDVACSNNDKFRGDTTRQYVRLKIKHMVDMLAAEVKGKSHWLKQDINVKDMAFYLVQAAIITSKSSSQTSTLSSSHPPPLAPLCDEFHIPEFLGGLHNLQQLNLWVGIRSTLTSAHYDANHNVLLVLRGEKRVTLAHHSVIPLLKTAHSWDDGANHSFLPLGSLLDNEKFAPYRMEVTVKSGSALFIPEGSFHEVRSSPGTIAVNIWYRGDRARLEDDLPGFHQAYLFRSLAGSLFERAMKKVESRRRRGYRRHSERWSNLLPNANYMTSEEMRRTFTPRMISERRLQWHRVICGASPATASLLVSALGESWDAGEAQDLGIGRLFPNKILMAKQRIFARRILGVFL